MDDSSTRKSLNTQLFSLIILFLWGISTGMVSVLSLRAMVEFPVDFRWADLIYHVCAYLWLSFLPFIGFRNIQDAWIATLLMIPLGFGLELGQNFVPSRIFSIIDMAANFCDVMIGVVWGLYLRLIFRINETG